VLDRIPVRWRLALTSSALTFVILCTFAVAVGQLTASRIRSDFNNELAAAVDDLSDRLYITNFVGGPPATYAVGGPKLDDYAAPNNAAIRIIDPAGHVKESTKGAPRFPVNPGRSAQIGGYRVETRNRGIEIRDPAGRATRVLIPLFVQYARPVSEIEHTVDRVRLFLGIGVLGGTLLALIAGLLVARRAMKPIAALTSSARRIAHTGDATERVPVPPGEDEIVELARTLDDMLASLDAAQEEREAMLMRQRQFVADASHELRTPLTSVLANLELLADVLDGERGEAARSALRSSQRMRRLVGNLLLLARADAKRQLPRQATDLGQVLVEAAAELGPVGQDHELALDPREALVDGVRDELHRLALNLLENAVRHTPPGTQVRARTVAEAGHALLIVEDDGPGVPSALRERIFERFVRGSGDRGASSSGLGLAIVRAVAESHAGTVSLEDAHPGTRFVVRLPLTAAPGQPADERPPSLAKS
jgi:two-component system OmpR family sensor kinase